MAGAVAVLLTSGAAPRPAAAQPADGPAGATSAAVPGLALDVREERYTIGAPTFAALVDALNGMRLQGPDAPRSQGLTEYRIVPDWTLAAAGGVCRVSGARVRVRIVVTLPEWAGAGDASEEELERWSEIERRIREHEYRHRDLTIEAARHLLERLRELSARGCTQLRRAVEGEIALADRRLSEGHAELDRNP